jgi:hypothetical protein
MGTSCPRGPKVTLGQGHLAIAWLTTAALVVLSFLIITIQRAEHPARHWVQRMWQE